MAVVVFVALMVLAPTLYHLTEMISSEADPLTSLFLTLTLPFLFIALLLSVGRAAR